MIKIESPIFIRNWTLEETALPAKIHTDSETAICHFAKLPNEILFLVFLELDPDSLAQASRACKVFYRTTKNNLIWENLFKKFLPKIQIWKCIHSPEQQFKCIFHHFAKKRAELKKQRECLLKEVQMLRGTANVSGKIDQAWNAYKKYEDLALESSRKWEESHLTRRLFLEYVSLSNRLNCLVGSNYNGTEETIAVNSEIHKLSLRILKTKELCSNQDEFELTIYLANLSEQWKLKQFLRFSLPPPSANPLHSPGVGPAKSLIIRKVKDFFFR